MAGAILLAALACVANAAAMTSHAGWPADQHLAMDKGPAGRHNTLIGRQHLHNYLLGGDGNDTIFGGSAGDVIWGDYHPSGWPSFQTAIIHAGDGPNFIYANDTVNYVWTGTNPDTVVHAHEDSDSGRYEQTVQATPSEACFSAVQPSFFTPACVTTPYSAGPLTSASWYS
jgi:hypothetical protein